jgi:hypothetical protein
MVPQTGDNGFRDRAEPAAMPQRNWSLRPGGMQGGMNLVRGVCATHRRYAKVLLAWGKEHAVWSAPAGLRASSVAAQSTECWVSTIPALVSDRVETPLPVSVTRLLTRPSGQSSVRTSATDQGDRLLTSPGLLVSRRRALSPRSFEAGRAALAKGGWGEAPVLSLGR